MGSNHVQFTLHEYQTLLTFEMVSQDSDSRLTMGITENFYVFYGVHVKVNYLAKMY